MNEKSDARLLHAFAARRDEAAFRELVTRYADLVYSAALRQVGSSATAADIAQHVFSDLARKADTLARGGARGGDAPSPEVEATPSSLAGWLHRATRYAVLNHLRDDRRRRDHERQAMQQLLTDSEPSADWTQIAPMLDEALDSLANDEREALLLRYFKGQDFHAVGFALGVSDDTAQKRVSRAVEKLREFFSGKKITIGAGGLIALITANAVQSAPVGLVATISAVALAGTAVTTSTIIAATAKTIAMTTLQKTIITAALVAVAGAGVFEARQVAQMREQNLMLQQQQAPLTEQIQEMQKALNDATNRLAGLMAENQRLNSNSNEMELMKLRGEVTRLKTVERNDINDPATAFAKSWAERVARLKQQLEQWPGKKTPETALLADKDWFDVAAKHQLETDADCRSAMSEARTISIERFVPMVNKAVAQYSETNNGQIPNSPLQLTPFIDLPPDVATTILNGYEMAQPGTVTQPTPGPGHGEVAAWAILQKNGPADPEYDHKYVIYPGGWYYYGPDKTK